MKIIDVRKRFEDQIQKYIKIIVVHWLAGTVKGSVEWLDKGRANGKGTVAYCEMIGKNGSLTILGDPRDGWFHNTNLGTAFDRGTLPIALELFDENDTVTDAMIITLAKRIKYWSGVFKIKAIKSHHELYSGKPDFPPAMFKQIMKRVNK